MYKQLSKQNWFRNCWPRCLFWAVSLHKVHVVWPSKKMDPAVDWKYDVSQSAISAEEVKKSTTRLCGCWSPQLRFLLRSELLCWESGLIDYVYLYIYNAVSWCFSLIAMVTLNRVHWEKPTARAVEMCWKWLLQMKPESVHVPFKFAWIDHPKSWITGVFSQNLTTSREFRRNHGVGFAFWTCTCWGCYFIPLEKIFGLIPGSARFANHQQNISVLGFLWVHKIRQQFPSNSHKTPLYAKWGLQDCYVQKFLHNIQMVYMCSIYIHYLNSI